METTTDTQNEKKAGDTANTVQMFDCNSSQAVSKLDKATEKLTPPLLTLIDILARQAAREICGRERE